MIIILLAMYTMYSVVCRCVFSFPRVKEPVWDGTRCPYFRGVLIEGFHCNHIVTSLNLDIAREKSVHVVPSVSPGGSETP